VRCQVRKLSNHSDNKLAIPSKRRCIIPLTSGFISIYWQNLVFALKRFKHRIVIVRVNLLRAILCALLGAYVASAQVNGRGFITGRVLDSENRPFENVDVLLYRGDSEDSIWKTATDELGSFLFSNLTPGTYSVAVVPKTYSAKTIKQIRVINEPSKPIVVRFSLQDRSLSGPGLGCATCAVVIPPDLNLGKQDLNDPVWNFWIESSPQTTTVQGGPQIAYQSIYPKIGSTVQLVVDLSAVAYDGFDKATYSRKGDTDFTKRLAALTGDSVTLDIIINPDPLYFATPANKDILRTMPVDLKKLRESQAHGVSLFASPRYMMRLLGEASADYSYGVTAFPVRTLNKRGWAPVNIEIWSHDTNTPLTEATAFFCVIGADGDQCGPKPPASAAVDTLSGVDLAGRGTTPDAALHISERGSGLVGVFRCNASFCPEMGQGSAWLSSKLTQTLNLLASQEAFAQSHPDQIKPIESEYVTAGRAIFDDVFYSEQQDPALQTVVTEMQALVSEGKRRLAGTMTPATLFARIVPSSSELLVTPWSLMVAPSDNPQSSVGPLGAVLEIESPLPLQSYLTPTSCISKWTLLVPPQRTSNPSDALSAVFAARDNFESWIKRFSDSCSSCVNNDPSKFGNWLTANVPASGSSGVVVLSHHSTDGNTDAYFMDVDADGNIGPATYANVSRKFADPSFAVLDACGTGKPASSEFIHQFNRGGIYSVISTAIDVNPEMAGKFLDLFMTHLTDKSSDNDGTIGRSQWLAVRDLSKKFGSRAFVFSLSGNSAIKACVPQVAHPVASNVQ
jgi:hypothetical protein